ncbi:MAG: UDP-galactose-4-epimerase [Methanoregula sp. PtaU1.Bin051]|nr:MAG: UDP-galactose-4-epimerase [Methanoregula sp. PtaU1.Bin051]
MTVLVTGATGFSGQALIRHLISAGERDIAWIARSLPKKTGPGPELRMAACDLTDREQVVKVLSRLRPDRIIHLAGLNRGQTFDLFRANITGTENLLDAALETNPVCRILVVSSSAVYGYAGREPISEDTPLMPLGDYGSSKAAQEKVALERQAKRGAQVAIARTFNLVGPGQPETFVCGKIVKQALEIERGDRKNLDLFETRSYRDFIDVRDAVRAYWALVSRPDFDTTCSGKAFNAGSGTAHAVSDVISIVEEITGRTYVVDLPEDPPVVPIPYQQADISLIRKVTGWQPEISLKESLTDMLAAAKKAY